MISPQHLAKVRSYIELGPKEGATLLCGGLDTPELPADCASGNFVRPTVFADVDNRCASRRKRSSARWPA
jgi:5-carboxymethyl-2-hydroxymuconic-semialdehyde dehydrogenase